LSSPIELLGPNKKVALVLNMILIDVALGKSSLKAVLRERGGDMLLAHMK